MRVPHYCSGCPHNSSTKVPEGSRALAGIGCHYMALWLSPDTTQTFSQMGGEGVPWVRQAPFTKTRHVFANLGDGTYSHSGLLAIRQAVAAQVSITYKILFNDAVAMTGGQPVEGTLTVPQIVRQVAAEGVERIVVVADDPKKYPSNAGIPSGVPIRERRELDAVQRELREFPGVSVLGTTRPAPPRSGAGASARPSDPAKRVVINDRVCENCGIAAPNPTACRRFQSRRSSGANGQSISPPATRISPASRVLPELRDRRGRQTAPGQGIGPRGWLEAHRAGSPRSAGRCRRKGRAPRSESRPQAPGSDGSSLILEPPSGERSAESLPEPALPSVEQPYGILVTGVGGTGVVTIGALLGTAAALENKAISLDMAGSPRKAARSSRISGSPPGEEHLFASRIAAGEANLVLGCDIVVAVARSLSKCDPARPAR